MRCPIASLCCLLSTCDKVSMLLATIQVMNNGEQQIYTCTRLPPLGMS